MSIDIISIRKIVKETEGDKKLKHLLSIIPQEILDKEITSQNYLQVLEDLEKINGELLDDLILILERGGKGDPCKTREQKNFIADIFREIKIRFGKNRTITKIS